MKHFFNKILKNENSIIIKPNIATILIALIPSFILFLCAVIYYLLQMPSTANPLIGQILCGVFIIIASLTWFFVFCILMKKTVIDENGIKIVMPLIKKFFISWDNIEKVKVSQSKNAECIDIYTRNKKPISIIYRYDIIEIIRIYHIISE